MMLKVGAPFLPLVCLQGNLFHFLKACWERKQRLALDLARQDQHAGFERVDMVLNVLRHNVGPFNVVLHVGEQWSYNLNRC